MSSSTALLPKDRKDTDHPIFLRICHSPWVSIDQKTLLAFRFLTSTYLTCSFILCLNFEVVQLKRDWVTVFEFSNIAYFLQLLYSWIAFIWTFMHLHYPHHSSQPRNFNTRLQELFSPPRQNQSTNNRAWFSIFYYAVNSFPFVVIAIFWAILYPKGQAGIPDDGITGHGWHREFYYTNKYGVNGAIAMIEVLLFSSIKRADAIWAHVFGTTFLSLLYVAWAFIGKAVTEEFGYYFFDHEQVGWDDASAAIMTFAAAANTAFVLVYAVTSIRENFTKKGEQKSYGYESLPR